MTGPLRDVTVLDLTRVLAGPYATMWLGDMGAEVLKVEHPQRGDDSRHFGPPFREGESVYFLSVNRNKRSLTLDFQTDEGQRILRELCAEADVLVENFRPGTLERHGLGYAAMSKINPELIYTSISGFGREGPWSDRPGFDLTIQGLSGLMSLTGDPEGPPTKYGVPIADLLSGVHAALATTMALYERRRTGVGQHVDLSMFDGMTSLLTFQAGRYFATGEIPQRMGNYHPMIAPYETFETADGYLNLALGNNALFRRFCELVDHPGWAEDDRYATNAARVERRGELHRKIQREMIEAPTARWMERLTEAGIPAAPILDVEEVLEHPQTEARGMVQQVNHPQLGPMRTLGIPAHFSETPGEVRSAPPGLGEDTEHILRDRLGYDRERIEQLRERGVV